MGKLGFLFEIENENMKKFKLLDNKFQKKKIIVFINKNISGHLIVGATDFREDECEFCYMNEFGNFENFLVFEKSIFRFAKIRTYDQNIVDFKYNTFWFSPIKYKEILDLFLIRNDFEKVEDELRKRVLILQSYLGT